jgi:hypothetical protein
MERCRVSNRVRHWEDSPTKSVSSKGDARRAQVGGNLRPRLCENYLLKLIVGNAVLF